MKEKELTAEEIIKLMKKHKSCCRNCKHPACPNAGKDSDHYCGNYMEYIRRK